MVIGPDAAVGLSRLAWVFLTLWNPLSLPPVNVCRAGGSHQTFRPPYWPRSPCEGLLLAVGIVETRVFVASLSWKGGKAAAQAASSV